MKDHAIETRPMTPVNNYTVKEPPDYSINLIIYLFYNSVFYYFHLNFNSKLSVRVIF